MGDDEGEATTPSRSRPTEALRRWRLDEPALVAWGESIGRTARAPLVIAVSGDLGTGKTTLARAIARGAGVRGPIPSPTYNLMFRYPADRGLEIVHLDLYRLDQPEDVWALGWGELPEAHEVVIVEWPQRAARYLPTPRWDVTLEMGSDEDDRMVGLVRTNEANEIPLPEVDTEVGEGAAAPGGGRTGNTDPRRTR